MKNIYLLSSISLTSFYFLLFPFFFTISSHDKVLNLNKDYISMSFQILTMCFFSENLIKLSRVLAPSIQIPNLRKKRETSTGGLTGELFHLGPCNVVLFRCESNISYIPSNFVEFIAQ